MNRFSGLFAAMAFGVAMGFAGSASALTADTLLGSTDANLNINQEEAFIESLTGLDVTVDKTENNVGWTADNNIDTTGDGVGDGATGWFLDVAPDEPGFFLVKLGGGNLPAGTHTTYVFENIAELTKLVFTDAQVNGITFDNIDRLSHYTVTNTVIPLPAALPLFLTALGGLGFLARRRRKMAA